MPANDPDDGFFVGYLNAWPGALRRFLPAIAATLVVCFAGLSLAIALTQDNPGSGRFRSDFGYQTLTGYLEEKPYPLLHVLPGKTFPNGRTITLVGRGKRGAQGKAKGLHGQLVDAGGVIIRRGSIDMLVVRGKVGLRKAKVVPATPGLENSAPRKIALGRWRLTGEICDGKCYIGAMRPGRGIARAGATAGVAVAVPLRETATRGRAQDKNANHITKSRLVLNQRLRAIKTQSSAQT